MSQEEFENLLGRGENVTDTPPFTIVYFTATWCGACRNLNPTRIMYETPEVNWLKCDIDQNDYTAGYCGIRSIPTFLCIKNKKVVGTLQSTNDEEVIKWVKSNV